jgi:ADP-heptose:LPS heptosyltransferase
VNSFLIIHQGAIGDFILSLSALEAIHNFHPEAQFNFFGRPPLLEIIRSRPYFGTVLDSAEGRWAPLYHSKLNTQAAALGSLPPVEIVFAFCRASSELLVHNLAGLFGKPSHRIDPFPDPTKGVGVSEYQCWQLEKLGIPAIPIPAAVIAPSRQAILETGRFVQEQVKTGKRLVLVHPGSGGRNKIWSLAGWLDIMERLFCYNTSQVALLQGPADTDIIGELRSRLKNAPVTIIKNWNLGKLASLMSQAALYLGNDSGITHLAAGCGAPTIALFGPTDPRIWGPRGLHVSIVRWLPQSQSRRADKKYRGLPPETELVWEQAKKWLTV